MVKFAQEMLVEMAVVTSSLETYLGPGTASLTARVGVSKLTVLGIYFLGDMVTNKKFNTLNLFS
jgi:hypothetical protein